MAMCLPSKVPQAWWKFHLDTKPLTMSSCMLGVVVKSYPSSWYSTRIAGNASLGMQEIELCGTQSIEQAHVALPCGVIVTCHSKMEDPRLHSESSPSPLHCHLPILNALLIQDFTFQSGNLVLKQCPGLDVIQASWRSHLGLILQVQSASLFIPGLSNHKIFLLWSQ